MRKYEEINKPVKLTTKVFCNKCGKVCYEMNMDDLHCVQHVESVEIVQSWGYFSKKDGETHKLDICENCYDEFIESFLIPPVKNVI